MIAISGTVKNGAIVPDVPLTWPEGTRLEIIASPAPGDKWGLDPSEWRDDRESLADWEAWINSFEPVEFTSEEEAERARFRDQMRP
jgi:hypothetical protein